MFINMNSVRAQSQKNLNYGYKKKNRIKVYARVHNKDPTLVTDWVESYYDTY